MIQGPLTALIVDDEPLARAHLRRHLEALSVQILGEAADALEALRLTEDRCADLLFLDIEMPAMSGMQLAEALLQLEHAPLVVFVTGYSEYAVNAFERDALDYLVKPVDPARLAKALIRARERLCDLTCRRAVRESVARRVTAEVPFTRLPIRETYAVRLLRVDEIVSAEARQKRVFVQTADREYRTYYTLTQLEARLPTSQFFRLHDAWIVNLERVETLCFLGHHSYTVRLVGGQTLPVSRYRYAALRQRLGLD